MTLTIDDTLAGVVQTCLRNHLADPTARLSDLIAEPVDESGFSGHQVHRARFCWTATHAGSGDSTWAIKRWLPGGLSERLLGIDRPVEVLSWEAGLLQPSALPRGVRTPIVGAWRDPGGPGAWIVMEDVEDALGRYSRTAPLRASEALARARLFLDRLARLHALWERPERQARLRASSWLVPMERFFWWEAASCATVLGKAPPLGVAPGSEVTDELRAAIAAFLAWLPVRDRPAFERLMCHRAPLVAAFRSAPRTLIHGDLDDRNVGLRSAGARAAADRGTVEASELVLIDWEWMSHGSPALDVARVWALLPALCDPAQPYPDAVFSGELLDFYLERYHAYGGRLIDPGAWRRSCALALLAQAMSQLSFIGSVLLHDVKPIVAALERQINVVLEAARSLPPD